MDTAAWVLALALGGNAMDMLDKAIEHYRAVESYKVVIRSTAPGKSEQHLVYFYRKPGFVRMEFMEPHKGAVLVYSPQTRKARLWPFGLGHFPVLSLSPGNPLIRGSGGQQVDRSDIGALFEDVRRLGTGGVAQPPGEVRLNGQAVVHLDISAPDGTVIAGVHRYELWLDPATLFPVQVVSRDAGNHIAETVTMEQWAIDLPMPPILFDPE